MQCGKLVYIFLALLSVKKRRKQANKHLEYCLN